MFVFFGAEDFLVAFRICTVYIALTWLASKMIFADYCMLHLIDRHCDALIKNVHLTVPKLSFYFRVFAVGSDAAMKLRHIFKAFPFQPAGEFFTADSACAIRQDFLAFEHFFIISDPFRQVAEVLNLRTDSTAEMAKVVFVIIAGIKDDCVLILHAFIEFSRFQVSASQFVRIDIFFKSQVNDFFFRAHVHFFECMSISFVDFKDDL